MIDPRLWKHLRALHRWAGLLLGVQITIWFASGAFMSFFDIHKVRGEHIAENTSFDLMLEDMYPVGNIDYEGGLKTVTLRSVLGDPVYILDGENGKKFINARTGQVWNALDKSTIKKAAIHYYMGSARPATVRALSVPPIEYRGPMPIWQVEFEDKAKTRLYLDPHTAKLNSVRTRLWRVFDFMWMLHIMDYQDRDNINNWWLKLLSFLAFLFALTGIGLVVQRLRFRR